MFKEKNLLFAQLEAPTNSESEGNNNKAPEAPELNVDDALAKMDKTMEETFSKLNESNKKDPKVQELLADISSLKNDMAKIEANGIPQLENPDGKPDIASNDFSPDADGPENYTISQSPSIPSIKKAENTTTSDALTGGASSIQAPATPKRQNPLAQ